jgi:8-oxo-dGTP pyrophosphatase MutT (NUDIX family)
MNFLRRNAYWVLYRAALGFWFLTRPTTVGAYLAIWHHDKVLVIKNPYKRHFTIPCGGLKPGESTAQAAVREANEEVGIKVELSQIRHAGRFVSYQEFKRDECDVYEVFLDECPAVAIDNHEVVSAEFLTLAQANEYPMMHIVEQYFARRAMSVGELPATDESNVADNNATERCLATVST